MIGIYLFEDVQTIDGSLKPFSLQLGLELQYQNKMSSLLANIINLNPEILIIDQKKLEIDPFLLEIFHEDSPFFIPSVLLVTDQQDTVTLGFPENCVVVPKRLLKKELSEAAEKLHQRKSYLLQRITFPFTQFDEITRVLMSTGFSLKNQGTVYIKDCISHYLTQVGNFSRNLGEVLRVVGATHETTVQNIERCIRIAIRNVWKNINPPEVAKRLGLSPTFFTHRPSCRELILFIGEYIYAKIREARGSRTICWNEEAISSINQ